MGEGPSEVNWCAISLISRFFTFVIAFLFLLLYPFIILRFHSPPCLLFSPGCHLFRRGRGVTLPEAELRVCPCFALYALNLAFVSHIAALVLHYGIPELVYSFRIAFPIPELLSDCHSVHLFPFYVHLRQGDVLRIAATHDASQLFSFLIWHRIDSRIK